MKIELDLSDIAYANAKDWARLAGNNQDRAGIEKTLLEVLRRNALFAKTPMGIMEAWVSPYGGDDSDIPEAGVLFVPDALEGEPIDLAYAAAHKDKVVTRVYKDIMTEDYTDEFAFGDADFRRAAGE